MRSSLKSKMMHSPLRGQSRIRPDGRQNRRSIHSSLLLTSLVDAFSILAIFLMMNSATESSEFDAGKGIQLPKVVDAETSQKVTVVKIERGRFFVNDQFVDDNDLFKILSQLHKQMVSAQHPAALSLLIIADRDMDYAKLNPLVVLGSRAGFQELRFAVVQE